MTDHPFVKHSAGRGFKALIITQFLGAFNDNIFKIVVSFLVLDTMVTSDNQSLMLGATRAMLVLPFVLFSSYAGIVADRYSKTFVIRATRVFEVCVMLLALDFLMARNNSALLILLLFMGIHSAIFSPAKYGILPELLPREQLSRANGFLELWTFLAIITGTIFATILKAFSDSQLLLPGAAVVLVAITGLCASFFIPKTPAASPQRRFELSIFKELKTSITEIKQDRSLFLTICALTFFWFAASLVELTTMLYASQVAQFSELQTGMLLAGLAVGVGAGCVFAGKLSEGKVELGLVPIGAFGQSLFALLFASLPPSLPLLFCCMFALGLSAGFFVVPLNSFLQERSPLNRRGSFIALANFLSFSAMVLSAFTPWMLSLIGINPRGVFLVLGLLCLVAFVLIVRTLPELLVRCVNWIFAHSIYRVEAIGKENLPEEGGALLVCNHASFVDPPLVLASVERPIRFLIFRAIYNMWFVKPIADITKAIPIAANDPPKTVVAALTAAREAVINGELVCIFAEGAITRTGQMLPFSKGLEKIMKGVSCPIIPVHIDKIWGSVFSFERGRFFWKKPKRIPYPVTLSFGQPLPPDAKADHVRSAIQELASAAFLLRNKESDLLPIGFVRSCKQRRRQLCVTDSGGKRFSYLQALAGAIALMGRLKRRFAEQDLPPDRGATVGGPQAAKHYVGIILPPSVAGVLTNIALMFSGAVPVNLNYTAGRETLEACIDQCAMSTVISSREVVEKLSLKDLRGLVYLEDLMGGIGAGRKLLYLVGCTILPTALIQRFCLRLHGSVDDVATVIFSSGSTGTPKGVMLSHRNIASNIEGIYDVFHLEQGDTVLGVLPFFHSFGFTGTLWLPLLGGLSAVYHHNPIDAATVGKLVEEQQATILMSTPTFLLGYIRKCSREQFKTLRYVIVGAEKLKSSIADSFTKRFGVTPLEGYGCTELSPVAMMNVPDYAAHGVRQIGHKPGTVGHPLPGITARIVSPESFERLSPGEEGLLLIRGPNVMLGYLNAADKTAEVIRDGWYVTGDIAKMDSDGFVTIVDRLSRFSKIGGEMVPHLKVEEEIHRVLGVAEQVCVVTALPDDKKGEKLVVLCKLGVDTAEVAKGLSAAGLPNLWIPKKENFYNCDDFPLLGTGKLDLRGIRALAQQLSGNGVDLGRTSEDSPVGDGQKITVE